MTAIAGLHGGEIYGKDRILYDFSININPLGVPRNVYRELEARRWALEQYPDQNCSSLRRALADFTGVPARRILCGNGASELIESALQTIRPKRVLLTAPSFSGYRRAAENCGAQIISHLLRRQDGFALTERFLDELTGLTGLTAPENTGRGSGTGSGADMVILCSPSNPVGNLIDPALQQRIFLECERKGIWLLADECFIGFLEDEEQRTMRRFLRPPEGSADIPGCRLLVADAFTKRFAMPGIRLGYLMAGDADILDRIHARQPEWSVSTPAQTAGLAALENARPYLEESRRMVAEERRRMAAELKGLGFDVFEGSANYIFFSRPAEADEKNRSLADALLEKGILIRDCSNYPGLQRGDYRAAVRRPAQNDVLLRALKELGACR